MTQPVIVLGGGGHAKVLVAALKLLNVCIQGIVDNNPNLHGRQLLGVDIIGGDDTLDQYAPDKIHLVNGIGSVQQTEKRKALFEEFKVRGYQFASVIHPSSVIAESVELGEGVQIMAGAVIQPGCTIGDNTIVNTRVAVDHDCRLGAHVHLAPGVTLSGGVAVGAETHIGTGASIIQGVDIGDRCVIGAASLVLNKIPSDVVAYGVPAKVIT